MQTILGSGGAIGIELAKALKEYNENIRLVSRNPQKVNPTDELMPADLTNPAEVRKAVEGSSVVYVTVGFPYSINVWKKTWPQLMANVIAACKEHKAKLVFFDNMYMYDKHHLNGMTEDTPISPPSRKGKVRAEIAAKLMNEVKKGNLTALIARCADFYGPGVEKNGILNETVINPLSKGKKANWMGSFDCKHSFTYTPDAGKATALLGNTEDAYNQVWHLPTASDPFTGREWIEAVGAELGMKPKHRRLPEKLLKITGFFVPMVKELAEMVYQYDRDYVFDSSKFEKRFGYRPVSYEEGIRETVKALTSVKEG